MRVAPHVNLLEYGPWCELECGVILPQCVDASVVTVCGSVTYVVC